MCSTKNIKVMVPLIIWEMIDSLLNGKNLNLKPDIQYGGSFVPEKYQLANE